MITPKIKLRFLEALPNGRKSCKLEKYNRPPVLTITFDDWEVDGEKVTKHFRRDGPDEYLEYIVPEAKPKGRIITPDEVETPQNLIVSP